MRRSRLEMGVSLINAVLHSVLMMFLAPWCIGSVLLVRSVRLSPLVLGMCSRVHSDSQTNYARAAASGATFLRKFRSSFATVWILASLFILVCLVGLAMLCISAFAVGDSIQSDTAPIGAAAALANMLNFLLGIGNQPSACLWLSRGFFIAWTALFLFAIGDAPISSLERR